MNILQKYVNHIFLLLIIKYKIQISPAVHCYTSWLMFTNICTHVCNYMCSCLQLFMLMFTTIIAHVYNDLLMFSIMLAHAYSAVVCKNIFCVCTLYDAGKCNYVLNMDCNSLKKLSIFC